MKCNLHKTCFVDTRARAAVTGLSIVVPAVVFAALSRLGAQPSGTKTAFAAASGAVLGGGGGFLVRWSMQSPTVERQETQPSSLVANGSSSTGSSSSLQVAPPRTVITPEDGIQVSAAAAQWDPELFGTLAEWTDAQADWAVIQHGGTRLEMIVEDMLDQEVDAIVNAANGGLQLGGGVAGAIRGADEGKRGIKGPRQKGQIQVECDAIVASTGRLPSGSVAATSAGKLSDCAEVLHAVGPVYRKENPDASALALYQAYYNTLTLAAERGHKRIAIPYLSSKIFGYYPRLGSSRVALRATQDFMRDHPGELACIRFCALPSDPKPHRAMLAEIQKAYFPLGT